jgi:hypothetical protein
LAGFPLQGHPAQRAPDAGQDAINAMMNDFRHAVRFLLRSPAFTLSALMVLSLGIGLNVTVFSILNALLWYPRSSWRSRRLPHRTCPSDGRSEWTRWSPFAETESVLCRFRRTVRTPDLQVGR